MQCRAGSEAAFTVYEQEAEEVTALAAQLLPAAALAPGAVLDRLLEDAVLHSGQVRGPADPDFDPHDKSKATPSPNLDTASCRSPVPEFPMECDCSDAVPCPAAQ